MGSFPKRIFQCLVWNSMYDRQQRILKHTYKCTQHNVWHASFCPVLPVFILGVGFEHFSVFSISLPLFNFSGKRLAATKTEVVLITTIETKSVPMILTNEPYCARRRPAYNAQRKAWPKETSSISRSFSLIVSASLDWESCYIADDNDLI